MLALYCKARYDEQRGVNARIPELVRLVLDRLAKQKELGDEELDDPWLFLPNLRDDVLREFHSLGQREKYWRKVRAVIEQNSNVRAGQREGRHGEVGRAWEWIGSRDGEAVRRMRSGRVSWGLDVKNDRGGSETKEKFNKWEEPRPFY